MNLIHEKSLQYGVFFFYHWALHLKYRQNKVKSKSLSDPFTGPVWPRGWVEV